MPGFRRRWGLRDPSRALRVPLAAVAAEAVAGIVVRGNAGDAVGAPRGQRDGFHVIEFGAIGFVSLYGLDGRVGSWLERSP